MQQHATLQPCWSPTGRWPGPPGDEPPNALIISLLSALRIDTSSRSTDIAVHTCARVSAARAHTVLRAQRRRVHANRTAAAALLRKATAVRVRNSACMGYADRRLSGTLQYTAEDSHQQRTAAVLARARAWAWQTSFIRFCARQNDVCSATPIFSTTHGPQCELSNVYSACRHSSRTHAMVCERASDTAAGSAVRALLFSLWPHGTRRSTVAKCNGRNVPATLQHATCNTKHATHDVCCAIAHRFTALRALLQ